MLSRPSWQSGFTIPFVLLLTFFVDAVMRFLPYELFAFRGWEVARRYASADGTLQPNVTFHSDRTCGELAAAANLPSFRTYRPESFKTDAYGYRNHPNLHQRDMDAILVGSSMSVGLGNSDEETLSARLTTKTGRVVNNASPWLCELDASGDELLFFAAAVEAFHNPAPIEAAAGYFIGLRDDLSGDDQTREGTDRGGEYTNGLERRLRAAKYWPVVENAAGPAGGRTQADL